MPSDSSYSKRLQGFINYERNTGKPHPRSLSIKNFKRAVVNNDLQDVRRLVWMGPISVGTPPVQFNVHFDTGSGNLLLAATECPTCLDRTRYDTDGSATAISLNINFNLGYIDGSGVSGRLWTDTVSILGLTATQQTLGAVSEWHDFRRTIEDGVMGMALRSAFNTNPVFQTLVDQQQTDFPIFAMKLVEGEAILTLGGLNANLYHNPIGWLDITDNGYWQIESQGLSVDGENILEEFSCIIDSARSN
jgi:cathepsin D